LIPAGFVRDLRDRTDIVEVIGAHVQLRKAGRSYVGLCPFHQEKSPSFNVNRERQIYHCFGCQKGGDAISFLMEVEGLSFTDAVRDLASRAGIDVPEEFTRGRRADADGDARRDRWRSLLTAAHQFFQKMLWSDPAGAPARTYLAERGCSREIADTFGLGFAPQAWDRLTGALQAAQHSPADLETMGLAVPRAGGGHYDRFRGRLMFPVDDLRGQVIAFSGRILPGLEDTGRDGAEAAKYINSPETPLYRKGKSFLGLPQARQAIRNSRSVILVEGNFDLVAVHALGRPDVLAPLGTAFTPDQATLLHRLGAETIVLLFDPDSAGQNAARRAFPVLAAMGMVVRWARLPAGKDPGSLLPQTEKALLETCLAEAPTFLERALRDEVLAAGESPESRAAAAQRIATFIAGIPDMGERDAQVFRAGAALGIARHVMHREVENARSRPQPGEGVPAAAEASGPAEPPMLRPSEAEAMVVEAVLAHPVLARDAAAERVEDRFVSSELKRVVQRLEAMVIEGAGEAGIVADDLLDALEDPATRAWARGAILRAAEFGSEGAADRYARAVEAVRVAWEKRRTEPLGGRIRAAQAGGDDAGAVHLLEEKRRAVKDGMKKIIYGTGPRRRRTVRGPGPRGRGVRAAFGCQGGAGRGAVNRR
jgi:DNA primase